MSQNASKNAPDSHAHPAQYSTISGAVSSMKPDGLLRRNPPHTFPSFA